MIPPTPAIWENRLNEPSKLSLTWLAGGGSHNSRGRLFFDTAMERRLDTFHSWKANRALDLTKFGNIGLLRNMCSFLIFQIYQLMRTPNLRELVETLDQNQSLNPLNSVGFVIDLGKRFQMALVMGQWTSGWQIPPLDDEDCIWGQFFGLSFEGNGKFVENSSPCEK